MKNGKGRTIVLLSAKRCGSTALFHVFQKHAQVSVCHQNQAIPLWETNFWNYAARAIAGTPQPLVERLSQSLPFIKMPSAYTAPSVFNLWDEIVDALGPIVFDKSPQYLGDPAALDLLHRYREQGNDVRLLGMIRDGRDAISSQYQLWSKYVEEDSPERREKSWLSKYALLMEQPKRFGYFPVFRYEDFAAAPQFYARIMFEFCGLPFQAATISHIRPENVGRYSISTNRMIRRWKMSQAFIEHLQAFGYPVPQMNLGSRVSLYLVNRFQQILKIKDKVLRRRAA